MFFLFMAISGVALNHTDQFELGTITLRSPWLLQHYGLGRRPVLRGNLVDGSWVIWDGERVYWRGKFIVAVHDFIGAVAWRSGLVVASRSEVTLVNPSGDVVDRLLDTDLPGPLQGIGQIDSGSIVLRAENGVFSADPDFISVHPGSAERAVWAQVSSDIPDIQARPVWSQWQPRGVSVERVLLDVHSGRFFGRFGPWFVDLVGLILTALAGSGLYLWWRRRGR